MASHDREWSNKGRGGGVARGARLVNEGIQQDDEFCCYMSNDAALVAGQIKEVNRGIWKSNSRQKLNEADSIILQSADSGGLRKMIYEGYSKNSKKYFIYEIHKIIFLHSL